MQRFKMDKVDTLYIHRPDSNTPLAETHGGINEIYKAGHFARFGLSNYLPMKSKRFTSTVKPTVMSYLACIKGTTQPWLEN
jgi:aryl-alcohol dehydrogenase-like predicted oxidoreductase